MAEKMKEQFRTWYEHTYRTTFEKEFMLGNGEMMKRAEEAFDAGIRLAEQRNLEQKNVEPNTAFFS
jgi:hypothetical protein